MTEPRESRQDAKRKLYSLATWMINKLFGVPRYRVRRVMEGA